MVKKGNTWSFERPCLININPDDFLYVADFLSTGDFGCRIVEDGEQREEAFAQCCSAWVVADELVMEDLLDYIVHKMEKIKPWGMFDVLAFADIVYKTEDSPFPAYAMMKDTLANFVADNYLKYVEEYTTAFVDRMKEIPTFLIQIHEKTVEKAKPSREESQGDNSAVHMEGE